MVRSNTDTTAGIRTNPPHLSLPPAVDGNKPASYVNRDTRPPAARRRTQCTTPNLGRDALVAKSVHPALNAATISHRQLLPPPQQWLFHSPAEASHFMRDAPRTASSSDCANTFTKSSSSRRLDNAVDRLHSHSKTVRPLSGRHKLFGRAVFTSKMHSTLRVSLGVTNASHSCSEWGISTLCDFQTETYFSSISNCARFFVLVFVL